MSLLPKLSQAKLDDQITVTFRGESDTITLRDLIASCQFSKRVRTAVPYLSARSDPSSTARVRAVIPYGTILTVVPSSLTNEWFEITTPEYAGLWIQHQTFTKLDV